MVKKKEITYLIIGAVLLVAAYFYLDTPNSLLGVIIDPLNPVACAEIATRSIVKRSISLQLLVTHVNPRLLTGKLLTI